MARKSKSDTDGAINLDSLMDALTNVVAVLILVLILVQADVTRKVAKFIEDLRPASPEEVQQSNNLVAELAGRKRAIDHMLKQDAPAPERIEEEKRRIALLEKDLKANDRRLADLKELKALEAKLRKERDAEHQATAGLQQEIARLEALLDRTPVLKAPPPAEVTIPNSRPVPPNAVVYHALAIRERIHMIDPHAPLKLFEEEFRKHKREWLVERIKQQGSDRYIYDQTKIAAHFRNFDFRNTRNQKVEVIANPVWTRLQLAITPDLAKGGTPLEDLAKRGSGFSTSAAWLKSSIRTVVLFHVNPDSSNAYLKGRALFDRARIPAGWEVWGGNSWRFTIPGVEVKRLVEPPPLPANSGPKRPPAIGPKLD